MRCSSALLLLRDFDQFFFLVLIFICNACYKRCSATSQVRKLESTAFRIPLVPQELRCRFQVMNEEGAEPAADGRDGTVLALPASSTLRLRCVWILWSPPPPWLQALTDIPASPVSGPKPVPCIHSSLGTALATGHRVACIHSANIC